MQKSIFKRYISITMAIIIASTIILGTIMMVFLTRYWREKMEDVLVQNVKSTAAISTRMISVKDKGVEGVGYVEIFLDTFALNIDADIFITDSQGIVLYGSFPSSKIQTPGLVDVSAVEQAMSGKYYERTKLGEIYKTEHFVAGVPLIAIKEDEPVVVGAVFATMSTASLDGFRVQALESFLLATVFSLAVASCLVGFFSYRMVKPLRDLANAVQRFGDGDYSVRLNIENANNDEIGQLERAFNEMAIAISSSELMRRSFIANVSHELKTPMTTISGFVDGMLDGTIPLEMHEKYMEIVSGEVKRLSRLVKSMLELTKIDNGEMNIKPQEFDLTGVIIRTVLTFETQINEKNLEVRGLDTATREMVFGDEDLIHQVVYNLIENAVKFTDAGGYISFVVTDSIDRTCVVIENQCAGIESDEINMIFERFYKTDKSRSMDKNGMGIGLYLVKTILKLHGGDVYASSKMGEYCRFEFFLPKNYFQKISTDTAEVDVYDADITIETEAVEINNEKKTSENNDTEDNK